MVKINKIMDFLLGLLKQKKYVFLLGIGVVLIAPKIQQQEKDITHPSVSCSEDSLCYKEQVSEIELKLNTMKDIIQQEERDMREYCEDKKRRKKMFASLGEKRRAKSEDSLCSKRKLMLKKNMEESEKIKKELLLKKDILLKIIKEKEQGELKKKEQE